MLREAIGFVLVFSKLISARVQTFPPLPKQPAGDARRCSKGAHKLPILRVLSMRSAAEIRIGAGAISRVAGLRSGIIALASIGSGLGAPALAQMEAFDPAIEAPASKPSCEIIARSQEEYPETFPPGYLEGKGEPIQALFARCNGTGAWLGLANNYQVIDSPVVQASVVELVWLGRKRVMLVSPGAHSGLMVEDLTGLFASKAGRTLTSRIDDLAFDYAGFAETGLIGITGSRLVERHAPDAEGAPGMVAVPLAESYSIKDHIDREKARRATVASALVGEAQ